MIPDWITKQWDPRDLDRYRAINGSFLKDLVFEMAPGKTCSEDGIVAEMFYQLDEDILDEIALSFKYRLLNHKSGQAEEAWRVQCLNLVKKKPQAMYIKDFRPIAIIPVLQKLYSKMLLSLT